MDAEQGEGGRGLRHGAQSSQQDIRSIARQALSQRSSYFCLQIQFVTSIGEERTNGVGCLQGVGAEPEILDLSA